MIWPLCRLRARSCRSAAGNADALPRADLMRFVDSDDDLIPIFSASYSSLFTDALAGWNPGRLGVCYGASGCGSRAAKPATTAPGT